MFAQLAFINSHPVTHLRFIHAGIHYAALCMSTLVLFPQMLIQRCDVVGPMLHGALLSTWGTWGTIHVCTSTLAARSVFPCMLHSHWRDLDNRNGFSGGVFGYEEDEEGLLLHAL